MTSERFADAHFAEPEWLTIGALACALVIVLAIIAALRRRRALARFASPERASLLTESVARGRRAAKLALLVLAMALAFVALARPRWGFSVVTRERRGVDILFAVDTSRSMLANDLRPDRLTRAKLAVSDLVRELEGDRAGLVAFAGEAFLQCPMTLDRDVFERSLVELDTDVIPRAGTDLAGAIRESIAAFGADDHERLLVLITDGEQLEGDAVAAAEEARRAGVRIFTVGVGSEEGSLVPVLDARGRATVLRDEHGELVRSALDEATLRRIAEVTGGAYEPLGASGEGLARLYTAHLATLPRHALAAREERVPHEQYQWPLALAILLALLEPLVGERRRVRRGRVAVLGAAAMTLAIAARAHASPADARRAYDRGDFQAAARLWGEAWEREQRPELRYDQGAAAYRAGDFRAAAEAYRAAVRGGDPSLQQRAYYDLGNAEYRQGEARLEADRDEAKQAWQRAVRAYESALALDRDDADARHNLELVRRRLAELEREDASDPPSGDDDSPGQQGSSGQGSSGQDSSGQGSSGQGESQSGEQQGGDARDGSEGAQQDERDGRSGERETGADGRETSEPRDRGASNERSREGEQAPARNDDSAGGDDETHDGSEDDAPAVLTGSTGFGERSERLTREQALEILRSLHDEERRYPLTRRAPARSGSSPERSW